VLVPFVLPQVPLVLEYPPAGGAARTPLARHAARLAAAVLLLAAFLEYRIVATHAQENQLGGRYV
jgi:hypothetical protein